MKKGLLQKIQSNCYWRMNIRPVVQLQKKLSFRECAEKVDRAKVSLRGWDYPHVNRRNDEHGGYGNFESYYEEWCDWSRYIEFWRMYQSSQFLHYLALRENFIDHDIARKPDGPAVNVTGTIYTLTEIVEFLFRLNKEGLYTDGATLSISLENCEGRQLWIGESNRMPFFDIKKTNAKRIQLAARKISEADFGGSPLDFSTGLVIELFDFFGWNPKAEQIKNDQDRFYNRLF